VHSCPDSRDRRVRTFDVEVLVVDRDVAPAVVDGELGTLGLEELSGVTQERRVATAPASRPTAQVNPNAVLAVVAVAQFMVILDATVVTSRSRRSSATLGSRSRASPGS